MQHAEHEYDPGLEAEHDVAETHHLPLPSIYPVTLAAGITLFLTGFLYGIAFTVAGLILLAIAIHGWIGEVNHEPE